MKLKILVGTMTGTAHLVAQAIQLECADLFSAIHIRAMDDLDINVFDEEDSILSVFLICTSTYGAGDVPDNAQAFYHSLDAEARFLGHVRYGVMALGDNSSHQSTFCFGGKKFDERLQDLGAQRIGALWCHDTSTGDLPDVEGAKWSRLWFQDVLQHNLGI